MIIYTGTKSKKKQKLKPKAERQEYEAWCKKHGIGTGKKQVAVNIALPGTVYGITKRVTERPASLNSFTTGAVNISTGTKVYTGDKMIGIAAMHKSNLVPVFTDESAVEISHMRR